MKTTLDTTFTLNDNSYYVEVDVDYYSEYWGADGDGNRGAYINQRDINNVRIFDQYDNDVTMSMYTELYPKIEDFVSNTEIDY